MRAAGHIETAQFVEKWNEGEDQANIDPPNATVSVLSGASVADAVVTISAPVLEGDNLTFDAVVLEGALTGATGPAALFIDRGGFGGFHGGGAWPAASTAAAISAEPTISPTTPTSRTRTPPITARIRATGPSITTRTTTSTAVAATTAAATMVTPGPRAPPVWRQVPRSVPASPTATTSGSNDRAVNYDPHNTYYGGGGYYDGDHPWAAGAAGLAAGAAIGAAAANNANNYPYPYCGYAPYPPCN